MDPNMWDSVTIGLVSFSYDYGIECESYILINSFVFAKIFLHFVSPLLNYEGLNICVKAIQMREKFHTDNIANSCVLSHLVMILDVRLQPPEKGARNLSLLFCLVVQNAGDNIKYLLSFVAIVVVVVICLISFSLTNFTIESERSIFCYALKFP